MFNLIYLISEVRWVLVGYESELREYNCIAVRKIRKGNNFPNLCLITHLNQKYANIS